MVPRSSNQHLSCPSLILICCILTPIFGGFMYFDSHFIWCVESDPYMFKGLYSCNASLLISNVVANSQIVHYIANMITNVSGTVFQLIHYFPGNQGLAINLLWPALQSKQHTYIEFVDITRNMFSCTSSADLCGFSSCWHMGLLQST